MRHCHQTCPEDKENSFLFENEKELQATLARGKVLKENRYRRVLGYYGLVLKEFISGPLARKAKREFMNLAEAWNRGLPVPRPYWVDSSSQSVYLLMQDLGAGNNLHDLVRQRQLSSEELNQLGDLCHDMILKGAWHKDFHAGNILHRAEGFKVVDWGSAKLSSGPLFKGEAFKLCRALFSSLEPLTRTEHEQWLRRAFPEADDADIRITYLKLLYARHKVWENHFFSRARKALEDSGSWAQIKGPPLRIHSRDLSEEEALEFLNQSPQEHCLKEDSKTRLWKTTSATRSVVIKEFRQPQFWSKVFGLSRVRRSWMNTVQLKARALPAALPLAFQENSDGRGRVVLEDLSGFTGLDKHLHNEWLHKKPEQKKEFFNALALFLLNFFMKSTFPLDMKTCNVMVKENIFKLVDLDAIRFSKAISSADKKKLLTQLHLSTPSVVTVRERWRFLRMICKSHMEAEQYFRDIRDQSAGQGLLYQTNDGDKAEQW